MTDMLVEEKTFDAERFSRAMLSVGHGGILNLMWHGRGSDWIEIKLPWQDALVGDAKRGVMATGPIFTLMDTATSLSV